MIILGVDPGLQCTGYGVISSGDHKLQFVSAGDIRTRTGDALASNLKLLYEGITEVITQYRPDILIIEQTFYNSNARTSLILGHARGVLMLAAAVRDIPVEEYAAKVIKRALTGNGNASKEQVKFMVERVLNYQGLPEKRFDISDALATALTHHHHLKYDRLIGNGG